MLYLRHSRFSLNIPKTFKISELSTFRLLTIEAYRKTEVNKLLQISNNIFLKITLRYHNTQRKSFSRICISLKAIEINFQLEVETVENV